MARLAATHPILTFLGIVAVFAVATVLIRGDWGWFAVFGVAAPAYLVWTARQRERRTTDSG